MRILAITSSVLLSAGALLADTAQQRLMESATVLSEIMGTPDKGIPQDLLAKAQCAVIVPNMKKAAFIVGGEYGRGFAVCRRPGCTGSGAPAAVPLEGGSVGIQDRGESADILLLQIDS